MKNNLLQSVIGYAFVSHVDNTIKPTAQIDIAAIYNGGYHSQFMNVAQSGIYKNMGYAYNLRPYLKRYLVKQYGNWNEYFAPNKTMLRKSMHGKIDKIVEIND